VTRGAVAVTFAVIADGCSAGCVGFPRSTDVNGRPPVYQGLAVAGLLNRGVFRRSMQLASKSGTSGAAKAGACPVGWAPREAGAGRSPATGRRSSHWNNPSYAAVRPGMYLGQARALVSCWSSQIGIMGPAPGIS